jgi:signal recognition particle subunit SRP54
VHTAAAFHESLELDGIILTKLDSDARGGAALSVKHVVGRPIAFSSTGEGLSDFDLFHPERMADRILGMGDVLTLIEQAERSMDAEVVSKAAGRMLSGRFTLEDFLEQLQQVKKMGSLGGMMRLIPGMSKEMRQAAGQIDDHEVARVEGIVRSMTPAERADPALIDGSRRVRIARGCGRSPQDVNQLLKQFREMQKMMRGMGSGMPGVGGPPGMPGKGMGRLGAMMNARKGMGDLTDAMGSNPDMAALMGTAPARSDLGVGTRAAPVPARTGAARQAGKKKKKGGRVTPPKAR